MGVFYSAPLLGPSLGPIIGGSLTQAFGWRAVFWFLTIWGVIIFLAFLFLFKDTFRRERSLAYQGVLKRRAHRRQSSTVQGTEKRETEKRFEEDGERGQHAVGDVEAQPPTVTSIKDIILSFADVNPFPPYLRILSRKNNWAILIPSGEHVFRRVSLLRGLYIHAVRVVVRIRLQHCVYLRTNGSYLLPIRCSQNWISAAFVRHWYV